MVQISVNTNVLYFLPKFLAFDICSVEINNIKNMHAFLTSHIPDILQFDDK